VDDFALWRRSHQTYGTVNYATEQHYTGKERDSESGLDYFGARYYASNMGRWMSPDWSKNADPIPYADLGDPQSLNLYMYGGNNPLSDIDFDGHNWFTQFAQGLADSTYRPLVQIVEHPIATAQGIGNAIEHPIVTGKAIGSAVVGTVEAAAHGDGRAIGQIVGTVGMAVAGGALARGAGVAEEVGAEAGEFVNPTTTVTTSTKNTMYMPAGDLPRDAGGNFAPLPEAQGPHTTLGTKVDGSAGPYRAMTFDENGKPTGRYDFTDHGRPENHPNPHYHPIDPSTGKVGGAQPMPQ
jgi:RHS repeat-associated protein